MRFHVLLSLGVCCTPAILAAQRATGDSSSADSLARRQAQLQAVTVTASRAARDEPASTINLTPAVIRMTPATNPWDLLRQAASVEVHDQGQGPGFASDASVRGFSSDHSTDLALWIDGVPINEPVNGHSEGFNDWSLIFPQAVNDLDVIKGPASALYGNFALAGVVNVRTLERIDRTEGVVTGGAYGRVDGSLLTGYDHGAAGGGVFGVRGVREDGWRPNSAYGVLQGHSRVVRALTPTTTVDAGVELYGARWRSPGFLTIDQFARQHYDTVADPTDGGFKRRAQERVSLRVLRGRTLWRSTVYATQGQWELFLTTPPEGGAEEGSGGQTEEHDTRYGFGATSAATLSLPRLDVTSGMEGRVDHAIFANYRDSARARGAARERDGNAQLLGAAFVQSRVSLGPRASLSLGARYDAARTRRAPVDSAAEHATHGVVSPKLGALVRVTPALDVYASATRGFRSPDNVNAHPELRFITAWSYETGVKLDRGGVSASAAAFQIDVSDEQQFSEVCGCALSGGASRRRGVEFSADARLAAPLRVSTDVTIDDATYRRFRTEDGDVLVDAVRVFNTARYVGVAAVTLAPPHTRWTLRASTNVVGPYTPFDETPGFELPAYALLHLAATMRVRGTTFDAGVRNLLDGTYPELRAGRFVAPGQPRSLYVGVRHTF